MVGFLVGAMIGVLLGAFIICCLVVGDDEIDSYHKIIETYDKEVNRQYKIIKKAIEYIEEHNIIGTNKEYLPSEIEKCYSLELMEILKGEDE